MKAKKIAERAKKTNPGRNFEKNIKTLSKKRRPGSAKRTVAENDLTSTKRKRGGSQREGALASKRANKEPEAITQSQNESREYSESIINTVREPLIILDRDLRVVTASRSFYDFFKVKPEETVGRLIYDLGNQQWDIPSLRELLETILPQKASFDNYEVEHDFIPIGRRIMLLNARQIQQALGKERIILLAIEDITERKRLEILLMESEELYHGVFKAASDGIVLLEKREGKITHTNPAAEKMLGYSAKECIGNKLQDIGFMLDLGDFQTTMQNLNKNGIINYEDVPVKTKSGQHIDTDIYLVNKTKAVQCNIRDITDRTWAESQREAALEALRNSEENFRRSLEDSPLGVRVVTAKGETIYANKALLDIYGYANVEELNKISLKERYTPQSYSEFHIRKKARERGDFGPSQYEINIVRKNKEIRHLQVLRKEILWNGSRQFQVIYQDITERKRVEEELRESEERYRLLFHSVNDSVFLHETKTGTTGHFKFLEVNDCACERLGYTRDEMLGLNVADIDVPEQAQNVPEILRKLYTDGQAMFETEHFSKDRVRIPMEVNIRLVKYKGRDVTLSVARDITERKRAESQRESALEVLRETRDYLDNLIGYANAPIITWDIDHRITKFNHAFEKFTGYHADEVIGQGLSLLFPSGSIGESLQKIARTSTGELWDSVEIPIKRKNGEVLIALWNSANIYAKDGKTIMATIAQGQDITERKRAEESIRASLTEKEILLKEVHHRVKNNLMTIIGLIKMQEMKADNKIFTTLLLELEGRIRAMALVHESLHKSEDLAHIDLKNYIETMSAHIRVQFGAERDIRFSVQVVGVNVGLDIAIPCGLILNEVIANAYKHAFPEDEPRAGEGNCEIKVIVNQEGGMNELIVTDNGVGLPAETNWENPETLGLRLVRMLSQQLNGSLEMERSSGTVFRLKFPVAVP